MKYSITLLVCCLCFSLSACRKEKAPIDQLPPATQTGAHTMGCLLNGNAWIPVGSFPFGDINPYVEPGNLAITAYRQTPRGRFKIVMNKITPTATGVYTMGAVGSGADVVARVYNTHSGCDYATADGTQCTGRMEITQFTDKFVSGTFAFTISKPGCETLYITEGRFDLKYN